MRLFVRGVLIGLVISTPHGFHFDMKKFSRYLVISTEDVGRALHELEAEGILQYERKVDDISVWACGYTEENVGKKIGFWRESSVGVG